MRSENYKEETLVLKDVPVVVTTYKVGDLYHCRVRNQDPGATISRASGDSADAVRELALGKAEKRL